ncbi:hypothetical protein [Streptomyces sp. NBC_00557]|uniref:hypothetical protein n=1 Tax=Streptomyces sp. NBC_00557 TaxID=2975776 RepID=UPI002E806EFE|nr:hypothetical protein [Streptomyces sp. NBC_00557]WUC34352.1 hypothetical protein OG956_09070 [Streptomyces sp. NBC_00557]
MVGRTVRWTLRLGLTAVWWWAGLRLALGQGPGVLEGAVVAGGWGLSVLPVHCMPEARAAGALPTGSWAAAWRVRGAGRASRGPRPGEVSDPP